MAGTVKSYNLSIEYVLHEMSWVNLIMYSSVLPSYNYDKDKKGKKQETIKADDPKNKQRVKDIIDSLN